MCGYQDDGNGRRMPARTGAMVTGTAITTVGATTRGTGTVTITATTMTGIMTMRMTAIAASIVIMTEIAITTGDRSLIVAAIKL